MTKSITRDAINREGRIGADHAARVATWNVFDNEQAARKVQRGRDDLRLAGEVAAADLLEVADIVDASTLHPMRLVLA